MAVMKETNQSALYETHQSLGAKCIPFAGYSMPVWYSSQKEEHLAVRQHAGIFDISHMGVFRLYGSGAASFLSILSCNSIEKAKTGIMTYAMFLNDEGMILDDVMFGFFDDAWTLVVNGANKDKIYSWMKAYKPDNVIIEFKGDTHSFVAIQGPKAVSILAETFQFDLVNLKRFGMGKGDYDGEHIAIARTGYTGEDGVECLVPNAKISSFWSACMDAGITPCGLAARDALRIEFGLPLYGQELSEEIHPFMTRYGWVVKNEQDFIGKASVLALKKEPSLVSVGLLLDDPMIARPSCLIIEGGHISSGTLSPVTDASIALAFVKPDFADLGSRVTVQVRRKEVMATVVKVPFQA